MRALAILLAPLSLAAAALPTPAAIEADVRGRGAVAAASALSDAAFQRAVDRAAAGETDWIDAISALRSGTDGDRSESIDAALSAALQVRPAVVLARLRADLSLPRPNWLCEDRAIEPAAAAHRAYVRRARAAVAAVRDPALASLRNACLAALHGRA